MAEMNQEGILTILLASVRREWPNVRREIERISPQLLFELKSLFEEVIGDVDLDADLRNKRQVYTVVADFLENRLHLARSASFAVACRLCGETDSRLLTDRADLLPETEALVAVAQKSILGVEVHYQPSEERFYKRITRIYFAEDGLPKISAIEEKLPWDTLPPDVRKSHLTNGASTLSFRLYVQGEESRHA